MVAPVSIIITLLGVAFALGFFNKKQGMLTGLLAISAMAFVSFVSLEWLYGLFFEERSAAYIFTAGTMPPFSISLKMGFYEALFTGMINLIGLLGGMYMFDKLKHIGKNGFITLLMFIMGLNVIIMTRDLFNLFVFLEISSIATAGMVIFTQNKKTLTAGFKYMLATGVIAGILLLGVIFIYYFTGSLNIDHILDTVSIDAVKGLSVAVFFLMIAMLLELKPFSAN